MLLTPEEKSKLYIGSSLVRYYINNNHTQILSLKGLNENHLLWIRAGCFLIIVAERLLRAIKKLFFLKNHKL